MKLELKHLAPYMPYGLKIQILNHKCDYVGIEFSEINGYYFLGDSLHVSYNGGSTGKSIEDFKPILRPLSDLTKEIEVNSEKFIPINYFLGDDSDLVYEACLIHNDFSYLPYNLVQKLLEWHFDVFGLIEQGLAIDINDLPNS